MTYPRQPSSTALAELSAGAKAALSSAAPKIRLGARRLFLYARRTSARLALTLKRWIGSPFRVCQSKR